MRAPRFWWHPSPSLRANLLRPVGLAYGSVAASRMRRRGEQAELPVICIGNFTAGGARPFCPGAMAAVSRVP
jgi:tetraacyldisaccharide 4'-kinase